MLTTVILDEFGAGWNLFVRETVVGHFFAALNIFAKKKKKTNDVTT